MGRRFEKKVTVNGTITLHHRYLYRGYLQIVSLDAKRANMQDLWLIHWDPTQPTATRPLSIRKNGTWYTYGHDLTKNVMEVFNTSGGIATTYDYTPFGAVTTQGTFEQPLQWSSEIYDSELALTYYNYRHYNPMDGRWINRDPIFERGGANLYGFVGNNTIVFVDSTGLFIHSLVSAAISAVVDIGIQVASNIIEDKPFDDINWVSVAASAISGAIVPGASVLKSCQRFGVALAKNQKVVSKVAQLQNKINMIGKRNGVRLVKITKIEQEQAFLMQTNNFMWAHFVKEEFTIYTFKVTSKELSKGVIQSLGIQSKSNNINECKFNVIFGQKVSSELFAEPIDNREQQLNNNEMPYRERPMLR